MVANRVLLRNIILILLLIQGISAISPPRVVYFGHDVKRYRFNLESATLSHSVGDGRVRFISIEGKQDLVKEKEEGAKTKSSAVSVDQKTKSSAVSVDQKTKENFLVFSPPLPLLWRIPAATVFCILKGLESFVSTALMFSPIGMVLKSKTHFTGFSAVALKKWVMAGAEMGVEWGTVSGYYAGAEALMTVLRQKEDRWNSYFGSGVASCILAKDKGPVAMVQGFFVGFGFVYLLDQLLPQSVPREIVDTSVPAKPIKPNRGKIGRITKSIKK